MIDDKIEKTIHLKAPRSRVWQALTDHRQFGEWFQVTVNGPFEVGEVARGHVTYPGYEHLKWEALVQKIEPERMFSFTWHPNAHDVQQDYTQETPTLVEFRLEAVADGTLLTVTESGFASLPASRRSSAFRSNDSGWAKQMINIEQYVVKSAPASQS